MQSLLSLQHARSIPCASDAMRGSVGETIAEDVPADEQLPGWAPPDRAYLRTSRPLDIFQGQPGPDLGPYPSSHEQRAFDSPDQLARRVRGR